MLSQIDFQLFLSILFEMLELDFGQELFLMQVCDDAFTDDLDDIFGGVVPQRWDDQLHRDFFLLADTVVAQYMHPVSRNLVCDALMNIDQLVELLAIAQETHTPVRREKR